MRVPPLRGKTVLDVGAWDGWFSFQAEADGASRVVALDHYFWQIDLQALLRYQEDCVAGRRPVRRYHEVEELWHPDARPGRKGFDTARELLESRVEPLVGDLMEMDPRQVGKFDVVFYLGVLYHQESPFVSLQKLFAVTGEMAIIETEAIAVAGYEGASFCAFYPGTELNNDVSNWWVPSEMAVLAMCQGAGFRRVEALVPPPPRPDEGYLVQHYRAIFHAWV